MNNVQDYGTDPLGNGMVRMVPSGEVVTVEEATKRLKARNEARNEVRNDIFGMSWDELERKQGGKLTR